MFKRFLLKTLPKGAAILCALLMIIPVAACKKKGHQHDFNTAWVQGETQHWHKCAGCDKTQDAEDHSYVGGECKCGKKDPNAHQHDFNTAWVPGETQHWHKCAGCEKTQDAEDHSYVGGECKCGKKDPNVHQHDFNTAWVPGETQHWHKCAGCDEVQDVENHSYTGGVCKCGKEDPALEKGYTYPDSVNFGNNVSVHDPSVFKDPKDGTYYVFGSHFAVASSLDLIHWTQVARDNEYQTLYGGVNWTTVLAQSYAHANANPNGNTCGSTWAPDVTYHEGKYYMYVSLSTFGSSVSAIARVQADSVLGPYTNEQVIITSNASGQANCIDPQIFQDEDGSLYLVYGSFFGGIYLKELYNEGANWGLPKDSGYGTLLWKAVAPSDAAQGGPEGPYLFYENGYYYLMVSDGSLTTNYHMRVARATSVEGPYYDITGTDVALRHGDGNKLAGNWKFGSETGLAAYGHNSVCKIDGEYFVIGHMRREGNGGVVDEHCVRVHRLLLNEEGWPVLSPVRYAGETLGKIQESEIARSYDIIVHDGGISASFVSSVRYRLTADHTILRSGTQCGTWRYQERGNYIQLTIDGITYKGVALPAWTNDEGVIALSATSDSGRPLWARGVPSDQDVNLDIVKQVSGSAKDTAVQAFDASGGFTVSFLLSFANDDWKAVVLDVSGMRITLPNIDTAFNTAGFTKGNCYPSAADANKNGFNYDCYMYNVYYVTISVGKAGGVRFYRNGVLTQEYETDDFIHVNDKPTSTTIGDFIEKLQELVTEKGFSFVPSTFSNNGQLTYSMITGASDLIVSRGEADDSTAKKIYNCYGKS